MSAPQTSLDAITHIYTPDVLDSAIELLITIVFKAVHFYLYVAVLKLAISVAITIHGLAEPHYHPTQQYHLPTRMTRYSVMLAASLLLGSSSSLVSAAPVDGEMTGVAHGAVDNLDVGSKIPDPMLLLQILTGTQMSLVDSSSPEVACQPVLALTPNVPQMMIALADSLPNSVVARKAKRRELRLQKLDSATAVVASLRSLAGLGLEKVQKEVVLY